MPTFPPLTVSSSKFESDAASPFFYLIWFAVPLLMSSWLNVDQFLLGKVLVYGLAILIFGAAYAVKLRKSRSRALGVWPIMVVLVLLAHLASWNKSLPNQGEFLYACFYLDLALLFVLYLSRVRIDFRILGTLAAAQALLASIPTFFYVFTGRFMFVFHFPIEIKMVQAYVQGGPLGHRNIFSIFMAQLLPLILIGEAGASGKSRLSISITRIALLADLVAVCFLRTRTAWIMVAFYGVAFIFMWFKYRDSEIAHKAKVYLSSLLLAVFVVILIPTHLKWKGDSPYLNSLTTMTSLKHSSGRNYVWKMSWLMFRDSPWLGVGAGQFSPLSGKYVLSQGLDTNKFYNQTSDYAFNDFFQSLAETGLFGGLIFMIFGFFLPVTAVWFLSKDKARASRPLFLLSLAAAGTSLSACFYYSFHSPCILVNYLLAMSLIGGSLSGAVPEKFQKRFQVKINAVALLSLCAFAAFVWMRLGTSVFLEEYLNLHHGSNKLTIPSLYKTMETEYRAWPWRSNWNESDEMVRFRLSYDSAARAKQYVDERLAWWPDNQNIFGMTAAYYYLTKDYPTAISYFRRAFNPTFGDGSCNTYASELYVEFLKIPQKTPDAGVLSAEDLGPCYALLKKEGRI